MKFSNFFDNRITSYLKKEDGIESLLKIQELAIPVILRKENCIVVSSTGTGKTLCFVLPVLVNLTQFKVTQTLIIVPTNELAKQIENVFRHYKPLFPSLTIYNSFVRHKTNSNISSNVVIASPTDLIKLIKNGKLSSQDVKTIIMDEADMLFEFFKSDLFFLLNYFKNFDHLQYCLFSATLHESLANSIKKDIPNCQIIFDKKDIWENENIQHFLIKTDLPILDLNMKLEYLQLLLRQIKPFFALVFVNNKMDAEMVCKFLLNSGFKVGMLYGEMNHKIRRDILKKANDLDFEILVCTDLAARGIDLKGVSDVISFDLPKDDLYYIHRAGRTGRGKYKGNSYIFVPSNDYEKVNKLLKKISFSNIKLSLRK